MNQRIELRRLLAARRYRDQFRVTKRDGTVQIVSVEQVPA